MTITVLITPPRQILCDKRSSNLFMLTSCDTRNRHSSHPNNEYLFPLTSSDS